MRTLSSRATGSRSPTPFAVFRAYQDVPLSELGRRQAAALGDALRRRRLAHVYASPLERARRTAETWSPSSACRSRVDDLRELSLGDWEGRTVDEIRALPGDPYTRWVRDPLATLPPGGEPLKDVQQRVCAPSTRIAAAHPDGEGCSWSPRRGHQRLSRPLARLAAVGHLAAHARQRLAEQGGAAARPHGERDGASPRAALDGHARARRRLVRA